MFSTRGLNSATTQTLWLSIELLPGAKIPFGRIFPLSEQELEALKDHLDDSLSKGLIWPSNSPAGAGIFFVKNCSFRLGVVYRELNKTPVKKTISPSIEPWTVSVAQIRHNLHQDRIVGSLQPCANPGSGWMEDGLPHVVWITFIFFFLKPQQNFLRDLFQLCSSILSHLIFTS